MLAWGLGYFGMPQVLLRFMAIRTEKELTTSRRIATVWVLISLVVAVFIGVVGRTLFPTALTTASDSENVFILLSTNLLPPLLAGLVMAGILAAVSYTHLPSLVLREKDIEQNHLCLSFPGVSLLSEDRYAMNLLSSILGGGMSSRLFQSVREKRCV